MANKKIVQADISLDSRKYEKELKKTTKTTEIENKKIKKSNTETTNETVKNADKVKLSNNNLAKNYNSLRTSSISDMDKIKSATVKMKDSNISLSEETAKRLEKIKLSNNNLAKNYGTLRASTISDMDKIKSASLKMKDVSGQASDGIKKANDDIIKSFKIVKSEATGIKGVFETVTGTMKNTMDVAGSKVKSSIDGMKNKFKELISDTKKTQEALEDFGNKAQKVGDSVSKAGDKLTNGLTKPVIATGAMASGVAVSFEYAFAKVTTLLDLNEKELKEYEKNLKKTAKEMNVPINEFAEATYQAISAGVDYKDAISFVGKAVKLAKGGFMETSGAVDTLTTILNTYGKKAGSVEQIQDKLIATQNKGKTTVGELGSALAEVIPIANSSNVEFNDLLGTFAHLTAKGIGTSKAGTMVKAMLDELSKSGTKSSDILKEKTGKSFQELMNSGMSLTDALKIVEKSAKDAGLSIGDMFGSSEASGAVQTILDDLEGFNNSVGAVTDSIGSAEEAYSKMAGTMKEKFADAFVEMQVSLADFGAKLEPLLDALIDFAKQIPALLDGIDFEAVIKPFLDLGIELVNMLADMLKWFSGLDKGMQNFILKGLLVGASLGPVLKVFGDMISGIAVLSFTISNFSKFFESEMGKGLLKLIKPIGKAFLSLGGIMKNAFLTAIPAIASFVVANAPVILAILAVIAVVYLLWKNWDAIKEKAIEVCEAVSEKWNQFKDWFSGIWDGIVEATTKAWDWIKQAVDVAIQFIGDLIKLAFDLWMLPWRFIWENFGDVIKEKLTEAYDFMVGIFEKIKEFFQPFADAISQCWNGIVETAKTKWEEFTASITEKWNYLVGKATEIFTWLSGIISEKWNEMVSYITDKWNSFTAWVTEKWDSFTGWLSETTDWITGKMAEGFNWVSDKISDAFTRVSDWVTERWEKMTDKITGLLDKAKKAVEKAVKVFKDAFNFEWKLPKLKLPKLKIDGEFSLNPPSVPSFGIEWHHDGAIFTRPTVIGSRGVGDGFKGMGANAEAVLPIDKLPSLLGLDKKQGAEFKLNIENFNNEREQDIEQLVKEIGYFARKRGLDFGI